MEKYKTFETERLRLRPVVKEDAPFILQVLNMPKWLQNIGDRDVKTVAEAEKYIADRMTPQLERLGFGNYVVMLKKDGTKIGNCGFYDRPGLKGTDIGFAFLPDYEGQGFGTESASRLMRAAREDFDLKTVLGITAKHNVASQKLLEKIGLRHTGFTTLPGETEELMLYKVNL